MITVISRGIKQRWRWSDKLSAKKKQLYLSVLSKWTSNLFPIYADGPSRCPSAALFTTSFLSSFRVCFFNSSIWKSKNSQEKWRVDTEGHRQTSAGLNLSHHSVRVEASIRPLTWTDSLFETCLLTTHPSLWVTYSHFPQLNHTRLYVGGVSVCSECVSWAHNCSFPMTDDFTILRTCLELLIWVKSLGAPCSEKSPCISLACPPLLYPWTKNPIV